MRKLKITIVACLLLFLLNSAQADLMLNSVDGDWSNPVGATDPTYPTATVAYGNTSQDQIRWGTSTGQGKSGLGFTGIADSSTVPEDGTAFAIGQLVHFNRPIGSGTAGDAVDLTIELDIAGGGIESFTFTLGIDETPNVPSGSPASDDFIFFPSSYTSSTFYIGSDPYTLEILGFGPDAGNILDQFQSVEGQDNATLLWGEINLVPVPGAVLLGMLGLGAAGLKLRRFA